MPRALSLNSTAGTSFVGREFLIWKPVHFEGELQGGDPTDPSIGKGDQVMILGFEIPRESRMLSDARRSIVLTLVVALLLIAATLIAWIMVIRSRLLAGQLTWTPLEKSCQSGSELFPSNMVSGDGMLLELAGPVPYTLLGPALPAPT